MLGVSNDMEVLDDNDEDDDEDNERLYTGGNMAESTGESGDRRHESVILWQVDERINTSATRAKRGASGMDNLPCLALAGFRNDK